MKTHNNIPVKLAPCGIFCGACPAIDKTCRGCPATSKEQARISKWACKIRNCCYFEKELDYCIDCEEFPCRIYSKKLLDHHKDDIRYHYRHEVPGIFSKMKEMGTDDYITFQKNRWKCDSCEGTIRFYYYTCDNCGKEKIVK
jgi:hypothetical protein